MLTIFCGCCTIIAFAIGMTVLHERRIRSWGQITLYAIASFGAMVSGVALIRGYV